MQKDLVEGTAKGKYLDVFFTVKGGQLNLIYKPLVSNLLESDIIWAICYCFDMQYYESVDSISWTSKTPPAGWVAKQIQAVTDYLDHGSRLRV